MPEKRLIYRNIMSASLIHDHLKSTVNHFAIVTSHCIIINIELLQGMLFPTLNISKT